MHSPFVRQRGESDCRRRVSRVEVNRSYTV